jgi:hypothetical protein
MRPLAPLLYLSGDRAAGLRLPVADVDADELDEAAPDDPDVLELDGRACGRSRPADLAFLADVGAIALVLRDGSGVVGAATLRMTPVTGSVHAREAFVAPSAAVSEDAARRTTLAVVRDGATRADAVHAVVPGPHPALGPLLEAGFRVVDRDTVMATRPDLMDLTRYAPSPEVG